MAKEERYGGGWKGSLLIFPPPLSCGWQTTLCEKNRPRFLQKIEVICCRGLVRELLSPFRKTMPSSLNNLLSFFAPAVKAERSTR